MPLGVSNQGVWTSADTMIFSPYSLFKDLPCDTSTQKGRAFFILQNILAYHLENKDTASFVCWELERLRFAAHLFSDDKELLSYELDFLIALYQIYEHSPLQIGVLYYYIHRLDMKSSDSLEQKYTDFYEEILSRITYWEAKAIRNEWKRILSALRSFIPTNR